MILTAAFVSLSAYGLHSIDVNHINAKHATELAAQKTALTNSCEQSKAITERISHDYQNKIADLSARVADLKRVRSKPACVSVQGASIGGSANGASKNLPAGSRPVGAALIDYDQYIDLLAEGEKYRLQVQGWQSLDKADKGQKPVK